MLNAEECEKLLLDVFEERRMPEYTVEGVNTMLKLFDEDQMKIIKMRVAGSTYVAIANELGVSSNTIRNRYFQISRRLQWVRNFVNPEDPTIRKPCDHETDCRACRKCPNSKSALGMLLGAANAPAE